MAVIDRTVVVTPQQRETLLAVAEAHGRLVSATEPRPVGGGLVSFRLRLSDEPLAPMGSVPVVQPAPAGSAELAWWRRHPRLFAALAVFALVVAGFAVWGGYLATLWVTAHISQIIGCLILSAVAHYYRNKT